MKKRNLSLDLLRILAAFMVIFIHVAAVSWSRKSVVTLDWFFANIYSSAVRSAVAIFFMISGALLLGRDLSVKQILQKTSRILLLYIFFVIVYNLLNLLWQPITNWSLGSLARLFTKQKYHLWYLPIIAGLYLMTPVFDALIKYKKGKYLKFYIILSVLFTVFIKTVDTLLLSRYVQRVPLFNILYKINYPLEGASMYYLLGYYLYKIFDKKYKNVWLVVVYFASVAITAFLNYKYSIIKGKPLVILFNKYGLTSFLEAVSIFLIFKNLKINKHRKIILFMSNATLTIYLVHPFIISVMSSFGITTLSFASAIAVPVLALICFIISFFIYVLYYIGVQLLFKLKYKMNNAIIN